jgi:hypothetical protein
MADERGRPVNAEERLAAVERYAQEPDWFDDKAPDGDYGLYASGYQGGYIAARRELRVLLGIEEGT